MDRQYVTLENKEKITINQVVDVDAFDEDNLWANIKDGSIEISGENLNIEKLDLQEGLLIVTGKIFSFAYVEKKVKTKRQFSGIFRKKS